MDQPLTPEQAQKKATDELVARSNQIRIDAYFALRSIARSTPDDLKHTGHKTLESALLSQLKYAESQLAKLESAFLKLYPD